MGTVFRGMWGGGDREEEQAMSNAAPLRHTPGPKMLPGPGLGLRPLQVALQVLAWLFPLPWLQPDFLGAPTCWEETAQLSLLSPG